MILNSAKKQNSGEKYKELILVDNFKKRISDLYPLRKLNFVVGGTVEKISINVDIPLIEFTKEPLKLVQEYGGEYQPEQSSIWIFIERPKAWPLYVWALLYSVLSSSLFYIWFYFGTYFQICHAAGYHICLVAFLDYLFNYKHR